jgi:DNA mismatch repair protein PMS2
VLFINQPGALRDNIVSIFGAVSASNMREITLPFEELNGCLTGYISKADVGCGRASGDRQYFFLNGRPVDLPKVLTALQYFRMSCHVSHKTLIP